MHSIMLMDELRKEVGGAVYGKDIKPTFNSIEMEKLADILKVVPEVAA